MKKNKQLTKAAPEMFILLERSLEYMHKRCRDKQSLLQAEIKTLINKMKKEKGIK